MNRTIVASILEHARISPDKVAVIAGGTQYTYLQLSEAIYRVAEWLKQKGAGQGDRIMVEGAHSFVYVALCYGIHLYGAVFVPFENKAPTQRIHEIAAEVDATLVLTQYERTDAPYALCVEKVWPEIAVAPSVAYCREWEDKTKLVEILFTTGTTGKSKGVMISYQNQIAMGMGGIEAIRLQEDDIWIIPTPMNHAAGLRKMHMCMLRGCTVCLLDGFRDVKLFFETIHACRATALYLPPSAIHMLLMLAPDELAALNVQLRFIYSSSATYLQADKDKMRELLPNVRMYNVYGGTETGIACSININSSTDKIGSVGKPHSFAQVVVVDDKHNIILHSSAQNYGYLAVMGELIMLGYWRDPESTKKVISNGMLITSDIGYIDRDGSVILLGRGDDVINLGGLKVAPSEVEEVAQTAEGVDECICIPAILRGNTGLKLLVVMKPDCIFDATAITKVLAKSLEEYKRPKLIEQSAPLPKTFNGKLDRKRIIADHQK